ncbi:DJ-1/PfpI family protein [Algoriphagus lacus]|uniref:DJ-1/PfpI family protein n=1 Tax=Algoriphagus lacus TaxID=2056311 RepID=A0A418PQF6_9BACT|nr:DJ-1/PfpI family protein [Algoriphagus lacus]RIW14536.1 DJ-1/PfpI family protein [Algoriphagus lacus]
MLQLGILIFDDVEVLDFAGPFEVFSVASQLSGYDHLQVHTFSESSQLIRARNGLQVKPDLGFDEVPNFDFLVIPGGEGSKKIIQNPAALSFIHSLTVQSQWTMSVCSGSRILGKMGFLDTKPYCTHHETFDSMKEIVPSGFPRPDLRFVQSDEKIWTAAGISAGIDLALHLLEKTFGADLAHSTATYMEYTPYLRAT